MLRLSTLSLALIATLNLTCGGAFATTQSINQGGRIDPVEKEQTVAFLNEIIRTIRDARALFREAVNLIKDVEGLGSDLVGDDSEENANKFKNKTCVFNKHSGLESICTPTGLVPLSSKLQALLDNAEVEGISLTKGGTGGFIDGKTQTEVQFSLGNDAEIENLSNVVWVYRYATMADPTAKIVRVDLQPSGAMVTTTNGVKNVQLAGKLKGSAEEAQAIIDQLKS